MENQRIKWYRIPIEKEQLAQLNQRSNLHGLMQCGMLLVGELITSGACWLAWQSRSGYFHGFTFD